MSFKSVRFAFSFPDLTASERLTLLFLANVANETGYCFPSQGYLAEKTGMAVRTIRTAVQGLEQKKAIKRSKRFERGNRTSDDYLILIPRSPAKSAASDRQNVPSKPTTPYGVSKNSKKEGADGI